MRQRVAKTSRPEADELLHDLRNGLTGVLGAIQIVRDSMREGSSERKRLDLAIKRLEHLSHRLQEDKSGVRPPPRRK